MEEHNKKLILRMSEEIWNHGILDNMDEMFAEDIVLHFLADGAEIKGLNALRENFRSHRDAFPDWAESIRLVIAAGDFVAIHFESSGTNRGRFLGHPPTGEEIRIDEVSLFRVVKGKIAEQWLLPDLPNLKKQLGFPD